MKIVAAARGTVIALTLVLFAPVALASEQESFYLGSDGFPQGSLVANPRGGEMPNYDLGRDIEPGLFLQRSNLGLDETEDTKYQHWQTEMNGQSTTGYPSVVIWSAPARFDAGKRGALSVYLLDCNRMGRDCNELGAARVTIEMGQGGAWVESKLDFDPIDHSFGVGRYLGVRVVVPESSESDMMLAYGYPKQRSRLTIHTDPPAAPVETAAPPTNNLRHKGEVLAERKLMSLAAPVPAVDAVEAETPWTWAFSLAVCTLMLIVLGVFLVSRLTKPGRHERLSITDSSDLAHNQRILVSASR